MTPQLPFRSPSLPSSVRRWIPLTLLAVGSASCVINTGTHSEASGRYIGEQTFEQVSPGKSKEFVLAVLGEPSTKTPLSDGTEIWKWVYHQKKKQSGSVLFVFNGDSSTETESQTFVQFKNDVVNQAWRD
jgi:outer membrane protein assembly factor BamE (lipoprotein component of BamABCDE complex)